MENRSSFTNQEKRQFHMKKYIKDHSVNFIIGMLGNILLVLIVLYLCGGTKYLLGVLLAVVYSLGKGAYSLRDYKKDYLDVDFPAD